MISVFLIAASALAPSSADGGALHTRLEESWPAADSLAVQPVREIRLRFSTAVQPALSRIRVLTADGAEIPVGRIEAVAGTDDHQIRVAVDAPLAGGRYTVEWGTAGPDGHPIDGTFGFRVDAAAPPAPVEESDATEPADAEPAAAASTGTGPPARMDADAGLGDALRPPGLLVRWLYFVTVALMVGTVAFVFLVVSPAAARGEAAAPAALGGARALGVSAAGVALAVAVGRLTLQADALFGGAPPPGAMSALLTGSAWGWAWILSVLGALLVLGGAAAGSSVGRMGPWAVAATGAGLAVLSRVPSGHAWSVSGDGRLLAVVADGAHMLGVGLWVGGLAMLALVALPVLSRDDGGERSGDTALWVGGFSRVALVGFGLLVASGLVSAGFQVGSLASLTGTTYGRTLLVKLAIVAAPVALGFYHWRVVRPRLADGVPPGFRRTAMLELLLALAVVGAAAVLVVLHLPEH